MISLKSVLKAASVLLAGSIFMGLSACTTLSTGGITGSPSLQTSIQAIGKFTLADLASANAIAVQNNDVIASTCYTGLAAFVTQEQAQAGGLAGNTVSGAFSAFEQTRVSVNTAAAGLSKAQVQALETACGPLVLDTQNDVAALLGNIASLGSAASTGGLIP